jgi:secreted trypsin-like serine protease
VINAYSLTNPNGNYEKIEADRIIPFPGFSLNNGGVSNDIALIHLKTPSMHTPIQLPTVADSLLDKDGALVSVIGWGVSDTANTSFRIDTLQEAEIDVIHNNICNETSRYNGQISDSMICAGKLSGPPTGGGAGDSGGPLFSKVNGTYIVLGAVSFGQKQFTNARYPGVYTRVREYLDWIDQTINSIGVEDQTKLALQTSIYQTQNKLTLEFKQALLHPVDLTIVDISGRVLQQSQIESGSSTVAIPLVHHSAGLYLVKLNTLQAHLSQKIVLE